MIIFSDNESVVFSHTDPATGESVTVEVPREYFFLGTETPMETACVGWLGGSIRPDVTATQMLPDAPKSTRQSRLTRGLYERIADFSVMTRRVIDVPSYGVENECHKDVVVTWEHKSRVGIYLPILDPFASPNPISNPGLGP